MERTCDEVEWMLDEGQGRIDRPEKTVMLTDRPLRLTVDDARLY